MPLTSDNDKPRSTRWAYLVGLGLLGLAGCVPADAGFEVDPMTGGPSIPQNKAVAPPPAAAVAANSLPPLPAAQGSISPAANASGATLSLNPASSDPSLNLRITGTANQPNNDIWKSPSATGIGVQVSSPDPMVSTTTPAVRVQVPGTVVSNAVPGPNTPSGAVSVDSYKQAEEQLMARGVVSQQLRQVGSNGVWEFSCRVPDPHNAGLYDVKQATAPGDNGVAAMRLVIQEIDAPHQ